MRLDLCLDLDLGLRWNLKPLGTGTARAWSGHLYESFDVGRCVTVFCNSECNVMQWQFVR